MPMPLTFDGHNDVLLKLWNAGGVPAAENFVTGLDGHLDVQKARAGGFCGGFFAIFVPSKLDGSIFDAMNQPEYDLEITEEVPEGEARTVTLQQVAILLKLDEIGALRICRTTDDIRAAIAAGVPAALFHIEGAEGIDRDLVTLDVLYAAGLRSLGPVWSRPNAFAFGAPFRFPATPDIGPGLTEAGMRLVQRCAELGIVIDLSHLNEAGFWDVERVTDAPLVATHSNAHAICPHARNLTDKQLDAIRERDGMVGLNFATALLRDDGQMRADTPLSVMIRHLDHLIGRLGEDRVGLGSDFDGAVIPAEIGTAAGLPALADAMRDHGFGEPLVAKIFHGNWLRLLERVLGG